MAITLGIIAILYLAGGITFGMIFDREAENFCDLFEGTAGRFMNWIFWAHNGGTYLVFIGLATMIWPISAILTAICYFRA
jgi:hypothetical protein